MYPFQIPHSCHHFCKCHNNVTISLFLSGFTIHHHPPRKMASERRKCLQGHWFSTLLTSKKASRNNAVRFQKPPRPLVLNFLLPIVLRAKPPCTFSTAQHPKVIREWEFLTLVALLRIYLHFFSSVKFFFHLSLTSKKVPLWKWSPWALNLFAEVASLPAPATRKWPVRIFVKFRPLQFFKMRQNISLLRFQRVCNPLQDNTRRCVIRNLPRAAILCTFWHLNFKKNVRHYSFRSKIYFISTFQTCSDPEACCTLRATAACNLSSLVFPNVSVPAAWAPFSNFPKTQTTKKNLSAFVAFSRTCIFFLQSFLASGSSPR